MSIKQLTIKTTSYVSTVHDGNSECQPEIEINHTFTIELEGSYEEPTFTMPEDLDKDQQTLITRAVDYYLANEYNAEEEIEDAQYNFDEDQADEERKYGRND
tara:strand:- start:29429 stop:29734 length:306 start_codon:yes stop_codon:yes gene_type:complete